MNKDLIKELAAEKHPYKDSECINDDYYNAQMDKNRELFIEGFTACQEMDKWISVNDRLPEPVNKNDHVYCLVYEKYHNQVCVRPYSKYHNCWDGEDGDDYYTDAVGGKISHWQPLPEPPKH